MTEAIDAKLPDKLPENPDELVASDILQKISAEYETSLRYVQPRREQFRDRLKLYNNQRRQRDKIGITSIYTVVNTLLAVNYVDELSVSFGGRGISGTDYAENLERVAKSDYETMDLPVLKYLMHWDRFFFGVGIEHVHGWDEDRQVPFSECLDPLTWLPDPQGYIRPQSFRFMGFELEMDRSDMTESKGYIKANVARLSKPNTAGTEMDQTKQLRAEAQGLDINPSAPGMHPESETFGILNWFTLVKGKRYLITTDLERTVILRIVHIKPVFQKERENELLTPWGIALHYYSPERGNPFGTSVPDLLEDKQRAKSVLANLKVLKEKADLYPMYMYNRDKILNRRDLDFGFNKWVPVRGDVGDSAIAPLRKDTNRLANTENVSQFLEREGELATGATAQQSGVTSSDSRTLGETQMLQQNANIRFLLGSRINSWGEKDYWKLWHRCYVEYGDESDEKAVELSGPFGMQSLLIPFRRFVTRTHAPLVLIRSKMEVEQAREREKIAFGAVAPLILQDPTKPIVSRRFTERYLLRLNGVPKEYIDVMIPPTPDEMDAHMENELLSRNDVVDIEADEDHLSHIIIHQSGPDTNAKKVHIEAHKRAYMLSGQMERDNALRYEAANRAAASASSAQGTMSSLAAEQAARAPQSNGQGGGGRV